jgi:hypothetical protein
MIIHSNGTVQPVVTVKGPQIGTLPLTVSAAEWTVQNLLEHVDEYRQVITQLFDLIYLGCFGCQS